MIHLDADRDQPKGWYVGPWDSNVPIPIGYANEGINEPHYHAQMHEVYLVARGESTVVVNDEMVTLRPGTILVVEPGEHHTFVASSADYFHFVIQTPYVKGDKQTAG
jgi:mannose-6-phosphate isomerase-like protein (cupin superfamily)